MFVECVSVQRANLGGGMEAGVYNLAETVLTTSLVIQQRGFVKMVVTLAGREISVIPVSVELL